MFIFIQLSLIIHPYACSHHWSPGWSSTSGPKWASGLAGGLGGAQRGSPEAGKQVVGLPSEMGKLSADWVGGRRVGCFLGLVGGPARLLEWGGGLVGQSPFPSLPPPSPD